MNKGQIDAAELRELVKRYRANEKDISGISTRSLAEAERKIDSFLKKFPMIDPRQRAYGPDLPTLFTSNPNVAITTLGSIGSAFILAAHYARAEKQTDKVDAAEEMANHVTALEGRAKALLQERAELGAAIVKEMGRLCIQIADVWWARRESTFTDIIEALKPWVKDQSQAREAAELCERPRELFRLHAAFSPKYTAIPQFNPDRIDDEVRRLLAGIAQLETA